MLWRNTSNGELHSYNYTYDTLGRLTNAQYSSSASGSAGRFNESVTYNSNSSIISLQRKGMKNNGTFGLIDDLTITYDGNHLLKVTDAAEALNYNGALDFNDGDDSTSEYDYDSNGALIRDSNRGIKSITYKNGHHPYYINMNIGPKPRNILNDYTFDGRKLSSRTKIAVSTESGNTTITTTDKYIDGLILRGDTTLLWQFNGGYVDLNANGTPTNWNYYVTDHLGSTRMVVDSNNNIRETINYYPFGSEMRMQNPALLTGGFSHPFRFTGKELIRQTSLNMYDFGARLYDVAGVPMWTSIDPLAEKYYNVSPYVYCHNNPLILVDPDGCFPIGIVKIRHERSYMVTGTSITGAVMTTETQISYYNFTESAAHLLSLVSGVSEDYIRNVRLEEFGGQLENNCITLGSSPERTRMLVSPTYFDESNMSSNQYYNWWFDEFSHEVGHIKQIERDQNAGKYLLKTVYGYVKTMSHDEAPREKEAEEGSLVYRDFRQFVNNEFKTDMTTLFLGEESEEYKINQLDKWWNSYKKQGK